MLPSHPTVLEPNGFSWGTLTNIQHSNRNSGQQTLTEPETLYELAQKFPCTLFVYLFTLFFFLFYCTWSVKGSHFNRPSHFGWRIYHIIYYLYPLVTSTGNYAILFVFTVHCGWRICCGVCIHSSLWLENMPWCLYPQFAVAGGHAMVFVSTVRCGWRTCHGVCIHRSLWLEDMPWCLCPPSLCLQRLWY